MALEEEANRGSMPMIFADVLAPEKLYPGVPVIRVDEPSIRLFLKYHEELLLVYET